MRIRFTLLAEGSSDRALVPIARWVFCQVLPANVPVEGVFADLSRLRAPPRSLADRVTRALEFHPCDILLVHRDADRPDPAPRYDEIQAACNIALGESLSPYVAVVPIRETEAWLLFNENAIRRAAGNPNGQVALDLPSLHDCEGVANPKFILLDSLKRASELRGRRLKAFRPDQARVLLADQIDDFSPLRELRAFQRSERDVGLIISTLTAADRAID